MVNQDILNHLDFYWVYIPKYDEWNIAQCNDDWCSHSWLFYTFGDNERLRLDEIEKAIRIPDSSEMCHD